MFITAAVASLAADGSGFTIANAGHPLPMAFEPRAPTAHEIESAANMPLGIMPDTTYANTYIPVKVGEVVSLVTDGLYEFDITVGHMFGLLTLNERLPSWWTGELHTFTAQTLAQLQILERGNPSDDRTMVAFTRLPPSP
ncbi:MAG: serine/threonine-protein phosphatase [Candidatus Synoicihabitans palmerolidicus]|nr:serine/threonine-protein phosphatase [Candidatus Synoicihabitans palmerolidicus]